MVGNTGLPLGRLTLRRTPHPGTVLPDFGLSRPGRRQHVFTSRVLTVLAALLVLFGLLAPDDLSAISAVALVRVPVEGLIVAALVLVLPPRARRVVAVAVGL